ncbi:macrolide export ATP-binding/permease protein MacB [Clostridium pasteurianum DSM 525 = ATCC 6013]|uniref:Fe(3+)-transporting ATPase n=1 Tax=Clostridium pasteurianum DSM 525 = ATCC 6013 TaxID=1262449 RepID=A0A0H3JAH3_CLOPA|nr:ATP-binding cassette domain-containing protein [Clostridium pasteurianum]AJA48560.1 macrolide export ATP-binding/permease protein MacB [Clostridium pasteurianum DSM 525 = ATCC 6013]AJA52548.1 macrolide export ATP-binding/permease protein MacB [Clostridium pasteurianum DSM 525 = ATCC 6013]AOZ75792.1 bacteriocin ABC transporter ATP-binding protein [Clostridium pasteurianum DSM 525 = ATCC 6013]AOZ79588.1 bacteriocin ABC transporter ATP-binding protein [Clostridium pasteurianum]ELP57961.1 ABC t
MIEIKNLNKKFDEKIVFSDFNLTIENGDFIIFSGPSGCGKTTLLNMIGAIEKIDNGKIIVDGIDIKNKKNHLNYYRTKIGFLFQNFALVDNKTVKENLKLIRKDCKTNLSIEDALSIIGLEDKLNKKIYTLSGGEQQRVALARLMLKKCDVILADEPTGSLDKKNAEAVLDILKQLNKQGKTIILVTHDENIKKQGNKVVNL